MSATDVNGGNGNGNKGDGDMTKSWDIPLVTGDVAASLQVVLDFVKTQNSYGNVLVSYSVNMKVPQATLTFKLP